MRLSRTVAYALQAIAQLAVSPPGVSIPCSQLAEQGKMPQRFLLQILRTLVTHGILQSTRGVEGGYFLQRSPAEVSLLEMIEAVDGPIAFALPASDLLPPQSVERLGQAIAHVLDSTRRELAAISLAELIEPVSPAPGAPV